MSETKHTPGPWHVDPHAVAVRTNAYGGMLVADVRGWGTLAQRPDGDREMDANAALIAAAPDLLAFANVFADRPCENYERITCLDSMFGAGPDQNPCPACRARTLVAAAEGSTP